MSSSPHASSDKFDTFVFKLPSHLRSFAPFRLFTIQHQKFKIHNRGVIPLTPAALNSAPRRAFIPRRLTAAFSLTEVVIAMGVAAVAFTSILALFPLGLNMSKESYEATQAALIAQTILADLQDEASGTGNNGHSRFIQIGGDSDPTITNNYLPIIFQTNVAFTFYLAYNQIPQTNNTTDPTGKPIMMRPSSYSTNPADFYNSGRNGLSAVVKVTAAPYFRINGTGASSNPMRIDVSVETPGNVTNKNRSQFLFTGGTPPG
jgi:uncharacterized protein (TIGR02598 family)